MKQHAQIKKRQQPVQHAVITAICLKDKRRQQPVQHAVITAIYKRQKIKIKT